MVNMSSKNIRKVDLKSRLELYSPKISDLNEYFPKEEGAQIELCARDYDSHTLAKLITKSQDKLITLKDFYPLPEEWKEETAKKGKKINQCEIVKHSKPYQVEIKKSPLGTFSNLFREQERDLEVYPSFVWCSADSSEPNQAFRIVDLYEANLIDSISEIVGEKSEVRGSDNEMNAEIPSRSQEELKELFKEYHIGKVRPEKIGYQGVTVNGFKRKDENFFDWNQIKPLCKCWDNRLHFLHYMYGYCAHAILGIKKAEDIGYIKIFPEIKDKSMIDYHALRFQVLKKNKNPKTGKYKGREFLTKAERDILLQYYLDNEGKDNIFDFSVRKKIW